MNKNYFNINKESAFVILLLALLCEKYILFRSHVDDQNTVDDVSTKCISMQPC